MSEKLDGVRAYWNGSHLYSKNGKEIPVPSYFIQGLESTPLDGELWLGRGTLQKLMGIINAKVHARILH